MVSLLPFFHPFIRLSILLSLTRFSPLYHSVLPYTHSLLWLMDSVSQSDSMPLTVFLPICHYTSFSLPVTVSLSVSHFLFITVRFPVHPSIQPAISPLMHLLNLSACLRMHLSFHSAIFLSIRMYVCISTDCLSLLTSANQSISLSIYFSTYLSIHLYIYPFIYLFIYLPVYVCCLPIYFSVCQTTKIPDFLRVTQSVCLPANRSLLFRLLSLLLKMNAGS